MALLGAGLGTPLGVLGAAPAGVTSWMDQRTNAGLPATPESEEDWQGLRDSVGQQVPTGALLGAGLGGAVGLGFGLMGGEETGGGGSGVASGGVLPAPRVGPSGGGPGGRPQRMAADPEVLQRTWVAERPPAAVMAIVPQGGRSVMSDEMGLQIMRSIGKAIEEGKITPTPEVMRGIGGRPELERVGQHIGAVLSGLSLEDATRFHDLAESMKSPEGGPLSEDDWHMAIGQTVWDQDSFIEMLNRTYPAPSTFWEWARVGQDDLEGDFRKRSAENVGAEYMHKLYGNDTTHIRTPEDRYHATMGLAALWHSGGIVSDLHQGKYLEAAIHEDERNAVIANARATAQHFGFNADDWNPYGWINSEEYELEKARRAEMAKIPRRQKSVETEQYLREERPDLWQKRLFQKIAKNRIRRNQM